jgi:hypothetical protein
VAFPLSFNIEGRPYADVRDFLLLDKEEIHMFAFVGLLSFAAFIVFLILGFIGLKKGTAKKYFKFAGLSFFIFFVALIIDSTMNPVENTATQPKEEEKVGNKEETPKKKEDQPKKQALFLELQSVEYKKEQDHVTVNVKTNLPDGTEIFVGFEGKDQYDIPVVPDSAKVENGTFTVVLGDFEDELDGPEYVQNGTYPITASFSVNKQIKSNLHLLEELGDYNNFIKNYEINGKIEKTDQGYIIEDIQLGEINITNAYTKEEIDAKRLADKKAKAKTIDFKQLDKNPDRYAGEFVKYTGEIIQILEGDNLTNIRLALDDWGNEVIYIEYEGYTDFVEEDTVTIYGEIYGSHTYTSQAGWNITLPAIIAKIIE